jgi:hypothetical protein
VPETARKEASDDPSCNANTCEILDPRCGGAGRTDGRRCGRDCARYIGGIGYVSNLTTARPWGLWIGVDVASGVALAAGGFTTAFLAHILGRHYYEPWFVRPC